MIDLNLSINHILYTRVSIYVCYQLNIVALFCLGSGLAFHLKRSKESKQTKLYNVPIRKSYCRIMNNNVGND